MRVLDAVGEVLAQASEPLRVEELTARILKSGLWQTTGKTPTATVQARLASDIKAGGEGSRFVRTAPSTFALRPHAHTTHHAPPPNTAGTSKGPMSFTDAAEAVLGQQADRKPMHYKAIVQAAIKNGWLVTSGQTPEATLYVSLISEIDRATKRGEKPRFTRQPKGLFGLSKWSESKLENQIEAQNQHVKQELLARLHAMQPPDFEALVGQLLAKIGFEEIVVTKPWHDGGIDVRGTLVVGDVIRTRMAVQAKRWKPNVRSPIVQQVRGSLGTHDQGLIITTSDFGKGAREEASRTDAVPVALMNGAQLVNLLVEHQIGVERTSHDLLQLSETGDAGESADGA